MKLYFMKQSALDYLKANMDSLYKNYFQFDTSDWIDNLFDYNPFEEFADIPDFELTNLKLQPGEVDLQNSKILYLKIKLSDSQASDERIWAGLCNKTFYQYVRRRWQFAKRHLRKTADDSKAILSTFYYKSSGRSGMFRNTLARCWWVGRLTYSEKYTNRWELLDAIGPEDFVSKVSDIFYSNSYSSNSEIVEGFCQALKFYRDRNIRIANREHIRPTAQYLNAVGGGALLDMYSTEEIKKMVVDRMSQLIKGVDLGLITGDEKEDEYDIQEITDDSMEEINMDYSEFLDALEETAEINLDEVLGELKEVEYGCTIFIQKMPGNNFFISKMPMAGEKLNLLQIKLLGKEIGHKYKLGVDEYEIVDIRRN